jgi:ClpP class serine protease
MPLESLGALRDVYLSVASRGKISDEEMAQQMRDNADLGHLLHMQTEDEMSVMRGHSMDKTRYATKYDNGVAVVDLFGPIYPRANSMSTSGATSVSQFLSDFLTAHADPSVNAVVINIDSPGGDVRGIGDAARVINGLSKENKKPIKAFASGYMASAAYYIGSAAQEIRGSEMSIVGSIGAVSSVQVNKDSGTMEFVSSVSPNKRVDPTTEEGKALIQQKVDDLGNIFVKDVARNRSITREAVLANYGQGDTYVGPRAKTHGLIDGISILSQVVEQAGREANKQMKAAQTFKAVEVDGVAALLRLDTIEEDNMSLKDFIAKFSGNTEQDQTPALDGANVEAGANEEGNLGLVSPTEFLASLHEQRAATEEEFTESAELFVTQLTAGSKLLPAMSAHAAVELVNAKVDDKLFGGTVNFINAKGELVEGNREEAVRARYEAMPQHTMTQKAIAGVRTGDIQAKVLKEDKIEGADEKAPVAKEREEELLAQTPSGRAVLEARKKNGNS